MAVRLRHPSHCLGIPEMRRADKEEQLTICGFFSNQRLALPVAVDGKHGHLVTRLRGEIVQDCGDGVSWDHLFPGLLTEQRLPGDLVLTNLSRSRRPGHGKAGVRDVFGDQVSG